jgi:lambda family phage minor tail protein L
MATLPQRSRLLEPGTLIKLFTLDLTVQGGGLLHFHPYTDAFPNTITFQGIVYQPFPIKDEGWDWNTKGTLPRPIVTVSNIAGYVSGLLRQFGDFVGCEVTRRRTFAEFLDGAPGADPTQEFTPDIFVVDQKKSENNTVVEFELSMRADAQGIQLPRRQIIAHFCQWLYRGADCTYAGPPIADDQDNLLSAVTDRGLYNPVTVYSSGDYVYVLINSVRLYYVSLVGSNNFPLTDTTKWVKDACAKGIVSCRLRFGTDNFTWSSGAIHAPGLGYTVGDVVSANGGTSTAALQIEILAVGGDGHVLQAFEGGGYGLSWTVPNLGTYTVPPPNSVTFSGGTGSGLTFDVSWTRGGAPLPTGAFPGAAKVVA